MNNLKNWVKVAELKDEHNTVTLFYDSGYLSLRYFGNGFDIECIGAIPAIGLKLNAGNAYFYTEEVALPNGSKTYKICQG